MSRMLQEKPTKNDNQSKVESLMQLIEYTFFKEDCSVHCTMIQYYDRYLAIAFSGRELFSDHASTAINKVKLELSRQLNKDVSIAVERSVGTVWIQK